MKKHNRYPLIKKIKYLLDDFVSKGFLAQVALLAGVSVILTLLFGIVAWKLGQPDYTEGYWTSLMHMIDQGTITADEVGTDGYFMFMLFVTLVGMAFTGTIIALVSNAIQTKLNDLQKGHSDVIERDHAVILGFNGNTCTICREIEEGSVTGGKRVCIVVADSLPKEEMEHAAKEFRRSSGQYFEKYARTKQKGMERKSKVLFRSGDPVSENTLSMCNAQEARAVIISREDDFETIRILLAVSSYLKKHGAYVGDSRMPSVVAMIHDADNVSAAKTAAGVAFGASAGKKERNACRVRILHSKKALGRLFVQTSVCPGLPFVLDGLFNYIGSSVRIEAGTGEDRENSPFLGKNFSQIRLADAIPLGFVRSGREKEAEVLLCPPEEEVYGEGDRLIYLSESSDLRSGKQEEAVPAGFPAAGPEDGTPAHRRFLLIGGKGTLPEMLKNIRKYAGDDAAVVVITHGSGAAAGLDGLVPGCREYCCEDPYLFSSVKRILENDIRWNSREEQERLTNIVLLSEDGTDKLKADERMMALLLNIRHYLEEQGVRDISVISEMQLPQNQLLMQTGTGSDFVVAAEITNRMIAQIAEDPRKYYIIEDLMKQETGKIELQAPEIYADTAREFNFEYLFRSAKAAGRAKGVTVIPLGWIWLGADRNIPEQETAAVSRLVLNPAKEDLEQIRPGGEYKDCRLVVLSGV